MNLYTIGGHTIELRFAPSQYNSIDLLPSFKSFAVADSSASTLFTLSIDDTTRPAPGRKLLRKFDTGNGDTLVYMLPDGGYQFIIRDTAQNDCCLLIANSTFNNAQCALNGNEQMRSFGLNNALMLCYAFSGSFHDTLLVHASCIMTDNGFAYPFIAASGTGKSTHTSLWLKHIEGCSLLNDDNPVIRIIDGQPLVFGSPWSGKTPCYRNRSAKLGAVTRIERAPANSISRLSPVEAFASLLPACSTMKWDTTLHDNLCNTISRIIETTPIYTLHCLPNEEAARLCHNTIVQ
jgi:hypothetical protein